MYKLFTDKSELFECDIQIKGASLKKSTARLVIETSDYSLMFNGKISSSGKCTVPIKKLKGLIDENNKGNIRLEVIAEDTYFTPWESNFEVETAKQVTVEVKSQNSPLVESKGPKVKVTKVNETVKPIITESERSHIVNIMKLLIKEDISINNLDIKKDRLNKIVATYTKHIPISETVKPKVMKGVLSVLAKRK